jgi:hypothetical protein
MLTVSTTLSFGQLILESELRDGNLPDGWSQTDVTFSTSAGGYANFTSENAELSSPSFDLSEFAEASLSFSVAKFGSGDDGPLTVEVSTDGGTNWDAQTFTSPTPTSSTYIDTTLVFDETVAGESDVRIRFTRGDSPSQKRLRDVLIVGPDGITIPEATEVSTIADLRAGATDDTRYRLTGEAILVFYDSFQNRRYLVDESAGIFSVDDGGNLPSELTEVGQGVTGVEGTLSLENNGALITLTTDEGSANATISSTGNVINPETTTIAELSLDDTGKLVYIENVSFVENGDFSTGTNYQIVDANEDTLTFRTDYFGADYIGEAIPQEELSIVGLVGGFGNSPQIFARSSDDFLDAVITSNEEFADAPVKFELRQNYPNPFNPSTEISYSLPEVSNVSLTVYNMLGQKVATILNAQRQSAGSHTVSFDASNFSSGVYLYRLEAGSFVQMKKMLLMK